LYNQSYLLYSINTIDYHIKKDRMSTVACSRNAVAASSSLKNEKNMSMKELSMHRRVLSPQRKENKKLTNVNASIPSRERITIGISSRSLVDAPMLREPSSPATSFGGGSSTRNLRKALPPSKSFSIARDTNNDDIGKSCHSRPMPKERRGLSTRCLRDDLSSSKSLHIVGSNNTRTRNSNNDNISRSFHNRAMPKEGRGLRESAQRCKSWGGRRSGDTLYGIPYMDQPQRQPSEKNQEEECSIQGEDIFNNSPHANNSKRDKPTSRSIKRLTRRPISNGKSGNLFLTAVSKKEAISKISKSGADISSNQVYRNRCSKEENWDDNVIPRTNFPERQAPKESISGQRNSYPTADHHHRHRRESHDNNMSRDSTSANNGTTTTSRRTNAPRTTTSSSSMWEPRELVEIMPGVRVPLHGSLETQYALKRNLVQEATCFECNKTILCVREANLIVCPLCQSIFPTGKETGPLGDTLGLGVL